MIDIKPIASGSSGNCYRVSDGITALLLDAGIPIGTIQQGIDYQLVRDSRQTGERLVYITDAAAVPYTFGQVHYIMNILSKRTTEGVIKDELAARIVQSHMDIGGDVIGKAKKDRA